MKQREGSGGHFDEEESGKTLSGKGAEKVGAVNGVQELHYERDDGAARRKVSAWSDLMGNCFCSGYVLG